MLLMVACCPCKRMGSTKELNTKDSVSVVERTIVKDSLIYTDVDSAKIKALVICPDGSPINIKPTIAKSKQATAVFEIKNGVANVECFCDSVGIISRTTRIVKEQFKEHLKEDKTQTVISEPFVPMLFKILSAIGVLSVIYWIYKLIKFFK